ncbi:hypothetical protein [Pseudovibrio denitrificans]|uniref:hypothetical protein n=1 Tax=Pseudovibrio denitrificans TaxID=258256 RepID=UPI0006CFB2EA|nr:hypothetical protein [Pseudovibrio denitrificans]
MTLVQERLFHSVISRLKDSNDFHGEVRAHFEHLVFLLIKFLTDRIDGEGKRFNYLRRFDKKAEAPKEGALQADLHNFLIAVIAAEVEKTDISSAEQTSIFHDRVFD